MRFVSRSLIIFAMAAATISSALAQQSSPGQPPAPPRGGVEGFPIGPPAEILSFTVDKTTIQPGESVTLTWVVVNGDRMILDHGIGIVPTRGSRTVFPSATITYTLIATGRAGKDTKTVTITVPGTVPVASDNPSATAAAEKPIPMAPDGKPDLSGVYIAGFDIRPTGKVMLKPGAEKYNVGMDYGGDLGEHCLPPGIPGATQQPYPMQIVQTPTQIIFLYEAYHLFRVVPLDKPHPSDLDPTWLGNSVGHWDGDTLVVDVTGFNDKTAVGVYRHTTAYHVVERYRRTSYDKVHYEATISDPNVFAEPWTEAGTLTLHPEWDLQEYICEENNHNYKQLFDEYKK